MSKERETRTVTAELRITPVDGKPTMITGHAAMFNSLSSDLGGFREQILPLAFEKSIKGGDIRALWNHDANIVLGRNRSGTLRLSEDVSGLAFEVDMPDTALIRDMVMSPIQRQDVSACSFGFYTVRDKWQKVDGEWIRSLLECDVFDVSPCTYPAYTATDVAIRSMADAIQKNSSVSLWHNDNLRRRLELEI